MYSFFLYGQTKGGSIDLMTKWLKSLLIGKLFRAPALFALLIYEPPWDCQTTVP